MSLSESSLPTMPLSGHLAELRRRILVSGLAWLAASVAAWPLVPDVVSFLASQVGRLVFVTPAEAFVSMVKIAAILGLIAASPIILVEAWLFVLPGLFPTSGGWSTAWPRWSSSSLCWASSSAGL